MRLYYARPEHILIGLLLVLMLGGMGLLGVYYRMQTRTAKMMPPLVERAAATMPPRVARAGIGLPPIESATPSPAPVVAPSGEAALLVVHVAGAVRTPGVYSFPPGARVCHALEQAGGARPDGYPDALNLAAKLEDGARIYVPTQAEWAKLTAAQETPALITRSGNPAPSAISSTSASAAPASPRHAGRKALPTHKISLNTAGLEELKQLPGVGDATAKNILDFRRAHGPFTGVEQLLQVKRIGPKNFEKMLPYLTL